MAQRLNKKWLSFDTKKREITLQGLRLFTFRVDEYIHTRSEEETSGDDNYSQKIILTIKRNGEEKEIVIKYPNFHVKNQDKKAVLLFVTGRVADILNGVAWTTINKLLLKKLEVIGDYKKYCKERYKERYPFLGD